MIKTRVGCLPISLLESWDHTAKDHGSGRACVPETVLSPSPTGIHLEGNALLMGADSTLPLKCCVIWDTLRNLSLCLSSSMKCLVMRSNWTTHAMPHSVEWLRLGLLPFLFVIFTYSYMLCNGYVCRKEHTV